MGGLAHLGPKPSRPEGFQCVKRFDTDAWHFSALLRDLEGFHQLVGPLLASVDMRITAYWVHVGGPTLDTSFGMRKHSGLFVITTHKQSTTVQGREILLH